MQYRWIYPYKDIHKDNFVFFSDYVYFETSSTSPFQIRRIEELNKVRFWLFSLICLFHPSASCRLSIFLVFNYRPWVIVIHSSPLLSGNVKAAISLLDSRHQMATLKPKLCVFTDGGTSRLTSSCWPTNTKVSFWFLVQVFWAGNGPRATLRRNRILNVAISILSYR